ncbi:MAG: hypothetical protein EOO68_29620 [Moraxellaceae bacterium]|nr:MAG: hypothetical protein EOO68_29620 [Moraxellaceae bacterium]
MSDNDPSLQRKINTYFTSGVEYHNHTDAIKQVRLLRDKYAGSSDYLLLDEAARYMAQFDQDQATNDSYIGTEHYLNGLIVGHDIAMHLLPVMEQPIYQDRLVQLPRQFRDSELDQLLHVDDTVVTDFIASTGECIHGIGEQAVNDELEGFNLFSPILNGLDYNALQQHSFLVGAGYPLFIADSILTKAAIDQQRVNEKVRNEPNRKTFTAFMNIMNNSYGDGRSD